MSKLDEYEAFIAVVDQGSLVGAARALHLSPSAISKKLALLERRLGVVLVDRSTRALSVTTAGRHFHRECAAILRAVSDAEERLVQRDGVVTGKLHLSCPRVLLQPGFMRLLNHFQDAWPSIRIGLSISDREQDLVAGQLDAVVRVGALRDSRLRGLKLGETRAVFCASPEYLSRHGVPESLAELRGHNMLIPTYINLSEKQKLMFSRQPAFDLNEFDTVDDAQAILARAREGGGVSMMLDVLAAPDLKAGSLVQLFPSRVFPAQPVTLLWRANAEENEKLKRFREFLKRHYSEYMVLA